MPENSPKLPVEAENLPVLDDLVVEASCVEHRRSILRFADRMLQWKWTTEQITHVAERWPWEWLARAVAAERIERGEQVVDAATLENVRAKPPEQVPPRPSETRLGKTPRIPPGGLNTPEIFVPRRPRRSRRRRQRDLRQRGFSHCR